MKNFGPICIKYGIIYKKHLYGLSFFLVDSAVVLILVSFLEQLLTGLFLFFIHQQPFSSIPWEVNEKNFSTFFVWHHEGGVTFIFLLCVVFAFRILTNSLRFRYKWQWFTEWFLFMNNLITVWTGILLSYPSLLYKFLSFSVLLILNFFPSITPTLVVVIGFALKYGFEGYNLVLLIHLISVFCSIVIIKRVFFPVLRVKEKIYFFKRLVVGLPPVQLKEKIYFFTKMLYKLPLPPSLKARYFFILDGFIVYLGLYLQYGINCFFFKGLKRRRIKRRKKRLDFVIDGVFFLFEGLLIFSELLFFFFGLLLFFLNLLITYFFLFRQSIFRFTVELVFAYLRLQFHRKLLYITDLLIGVVGALDSRINNNYYRSRKFWIGIFAQLIFSLLICFFLKGFLLQYSFFNNQNFLISWVGEPFRTVSRGVGFSVPLGFILAVLTLFLPVLGPLLFRTKLYMELETFRFFSSYVSVVFIFLTVFLPCYSDTSISSSATSLALIYLLLFLVLFPLANTLDLYILIEGVQPLKNEFLLIKKIKVSTLFRPYPVGWGLVCPIIVTRFKRAGGSIRAIFVFLWQTMVECFSIRKRVRKVFIFLDVHFLTALRAVAGKLFDHLWQRFVIILFFTLVVRFLVSIEWGKLLLSIITTF